MDVFVLQSFVWPKKKNDLYVVATRKLTGFGLKTSRDHMVTYSSRDAPVPSVHDDCLGCFGLLLKLDPLRTEDSAGSAHPHAHRKSILESCFLSY